MASTPWRDRPYEEVMAAASDPDTPARVFTILASDRRIAVIRALAQNPGVPRRMLVELSQSYGSQIAAYLVRNPATLDIDVPADARHRYRRLTADPWHGRTSATLFDVASAYGGQWVRVGQSKNPRCPDDLLAKRLLSPEMDGYISRCAARTLGREGLSRLARSTKAEQRLAAATSPSTPVDDLADLENDRAKKVRAAALRTLAELVGNGNRSAERVVQARVASLSTRARKPPAQALDPLADYFDHDPTDEEILGLLLRLE